jgi:hypothetical protein
VTQFESGLGEFLLLHIEYFVGFNNFDIILNRCDGFGQARRAGNYLGHNAYSVGGHAPDNKPMRAGMAAQG